MPPLTFVNGQPARASAVTLSLSRHELEHGLTSTAQISLPIARFRRAINPLNLSFGVNLGAQVTMKT